MSIQDVLSAIDSEIALIEQARALLTGYAASKGRRKSTNTQPIKAKRILSAAARKKISEAQRKRWAAQRKAAK